jgi:hypothetical protein
MLDLVVVVPAVVWMVVLCNGIAKWNTMACFNPLRYNISLKVKIGGLKT